MSVNPGFGGQQFIKSVLPKITEVRRRITALGKPIWLEVDGGVKTDNIAEIARAGADTFVAGSAIFGSKDYAATIRGMRERLAVLYSLRVAPPRTFLRKSQLAPLAPLIPHASPRGSAMRESRP